MAAPVFTRNGYRRYADNGQAITADLDGPPTVGQIGAVRVQWERLGVTDRAERLRLTGILAGLDAPPTSTAALSAGLAGRVFRLLRSCPDRASAYRLASLMTPGPTDADRARRRAQLFRQLIRLGVIQA